VFYFDSTMLIILPALLLATFAQMRVSSTFSRYKNVAARSGLTGAEMARALLQSEGVTNVKIERVSGSLTDHYDPRSLTLRLSDSTYSSTGVAALGVAAHEVGHVLQHRDSYGPLMLRSMSVSVVNIGSTLSWPLFLLGIVLSWQPLLYIGIALFSLTVLFSLITLPVEFNASRRAVAALEAKGILSRDELPGAKKVLSAAAMTYVASALTAILQLVRLLVIAGVGHRRD